MKKLLLFLFLLTVFTSIFAQTVPNAGTTITNAIPPSPDAAALGKYGSLPIGTFTGTTNISIPIYTIQSGDLTLPISISYHTGGIKIEEMASSVGLGWAFNAGGSITRTVRGLPDEAVYGLLDTPYNVIVVNKLMQLSGQNYSSAQITTLNTTLNHFADGSYDGESDIYNFNFGNYTGKFVMDSYGNVYVLPQQKIKFRFQIANQNSINAYIQSFTAVTPDGVTYIIGSDGDGNDAVEFTNTNRSNNGGNINKSKVATAWFIKKIISPTGHQIIFNYKGETVGNQQTVSNSSYYYIGCYECPANATTMTQANDNFVSSNTISTVKLTSITFDNGTLNITSNTNRNDNPLNSTAIDALTIQSNTGSLNKTINFYYTNNTTFRLRLDSVIEQLTTNCSGCNVNHEKYSFLYNADPWRNINTNANISFQQDFWGYYNGIGNTTLSPQYLYGSALIPGAIRAPDEQSMLGGMLVQVNYPTGGYTQFSYEANHEFTKDFGGTSTKYPPTHEMAAICNDPNNSLYNYDSNNGNPNNTMALVSPSNNVVQLEIKTTGLNNPPSITLAVNLFQIVSGGQNVNLGHLTSADTIFYLNPGNYQLVLADPKNQAYPNPTGIKYSVSAQWNIPDSLLAGNYISGGVRIAQIADYDGINPNPVNLRSYKYTTPGSNASSGQLNGNPSYLYNLQKDYIIQPGTASQTSYYGIIYNVSSAYSNIPLGTSQGSVVGYNHVLEYIGANGQGGMNEYYYTFIPDLISTGFPFSPSIDQSWKTGLLTDEINYKYVSPNVFTPVKQKISNYNYNTVGNIISIHAGFSETPGAGGYAPNGNFYTGPQNFVYGGALKALAYNNYTDFTYLTSDTTKIYNMNDPTKYVTSYNSYNYDRGSFQLSQLNSINSKNEIVSTNVTYPDDYIISSSTNNSALNGILNLQNINMLNVPVEEITTKQNSNGNNLRTTKAILTTYKPTLPVKDSVFEARFVTPVTNFSPSAIISNNLSKDPHYQPVVNYSKYDLNGNIIQESKIGDVQHSYIWGYTNKNQPIYNTFPIAQVVNADSASIAYTNFESYNSAGYGNWIYSNSGVTTDQTAPMGSNCYSLSGNAISKNGLNSGLTYIISFWAKQNTSVNITGGTIASNPAGTTLNGWTYYEYIVNGAASISISGSGYIDELRLYPSTAQMTTYTYLPLVGISSVCSAKSEISYYQYDSVGRLINVLDQYGNIVKNYSYHYQGQ